ncbi:MAG: hypothetical protein U5K79_03160 [Cyclobacteriaceae bacterium]|nr:hypothetical protein [Cyclobacteriaceae bacterium]
MVQKAFLIANSKNKMSYVNTDKPSEQIWIDLSPLPAERANIFSYLSAVINGTINPGKDLSSFPVNEIVVEILSAARESAKTGRTIYLNK